MRRSFVLGAVVALVVEAIVAGVVIASGVVDVAARPKGGLDRVLDFAATRSLAHHARPGPNPLANDPAAVRKGLGHYREDCVVCHGGPGVHAGELAAGLHPRPPDLASPRVQAFTDGMLYEAISGGVDSTGMPAFRSSHSTEDLWSIVAFLRHLPALSADEKAELARPERGGEMDEMETSGEAPSRGAQPQREPAPAAPAGPGRRVRTVSISSFEFGPKTLEVHVGDVVEWRNDDMVDHTATAEDRTFDTGQIAGGEAKRVVVRKKGRFPYFCRDHPEMKATLVVD